MIIQFPRFGFPEIMPSSIDFTQILGLPQYISNEWAISFLSLGIGFIAGRNGLFVLGGGVLSYWVIVPAVISLGWIPESITLENSASFIHSEMTRPIGIGMLIGGSLMSIVLIIPAIKATIKSFKHKIDARYWFR